MRRAPLTALLILTTAACGFAQQTKPSKDPSRVLPPGQLPKDSRLGKPRDLYDKYHPWTPPKTLAEWKKERQRLREQVLVSQGLWPMPPKTPLKAVVHGKIDRGDYTVEKVYFQSHPGHYVTGNLYRPKRKGEPGGVSPRSPGVLCPHGHWGNARFYDAGEAAAKKLIAGGGETHMAAARHHIQARMVGLARLGCVVFHYDMVGYSDSKAIGHRAGFTDAEASLRLQNFMGLQTWNSIRALDFLTSLPDVDTKRIGITGASGGGTQTFMLAAIDDRVTAAFPAVMVSTGMQGGCICENAEYLRIGVNNIALAALFAPKPQALSGADDWTVAIETKGYPELRQVYSLYGKPENIAAKAFPQFKHNYNQVAREMMYEWFNRHLRLGHKSPIKERDFEPLSQKELTVWTDKPPHPKDAKSAADLRKYLTKVSDDQFAKLVPQTKGDVRRYREVVGAAARVMFGEVPQSSDVKSSSERFLEIGKTVVYQSTLSRKSESQQIPVIAVWQSPKTKALVWIDGNGKSQLFAKSGKPKAAAEQLLAKDVYLVSIDPYNTGEYLSNGKAKRASVNQTYAGYTFGYNHSLLTDRVRDILAVSAGGREKGKTTDLLGTGDAGVWTLLAAAQLGKKVDRVIVDLNGFSFRKLNSTADANFLPGALKYGGLGGLAALAAPTELVLYGTKGIPKAELAPLIQMYKVTGGKLTLHEGKLTDELVVKDVLKKN
jgi:dienelactone hydrolase